MSGPPSPSIFTLACTATTSASAVDEERYIRLAKDWIRFLARQRPLLVCLPAGFLVTGSLAEKDYWVTQLMMLSSECRLSLAFGIDIAHPGGKRYRLDSNIYFCKNGRLECEIGSDDEVRATRCIYLDGWKIGLLFAKELFPPEPRRQAMALAPDFWLVLSHTGPTSRWRWALRMLSRSAPVVLVGGAHEVPAALPYLVPRRRIAVAEQLTLFAHQPSRQRTPIANSDLSLSATHGTMHK